MEDEMIDIVDENDKVVDIKPKSEVREKVLTHRGVDILLLNSRNEIFVHQRALTKMTYPGYWSLFAGGFVSHGEDYEQAALRELEEETGIKTDKLELIGNFRYKVENDDWFGKLFRITSDQKLKLQQEEIEKGMFIPIEQLGEFVRKNKIKPSNLFIYNRFKDKLK
jgi:isopentenyldiphosphate isomerase